MATAAQQATQTAQTNGTGPAPTRTPYFCPLSFDQVLALPPKKWLVENVIGEGDLAMLFGAPGAGKSFLAIDLLFAAALGKNWTGRYLEPGSGFKIARPLQVAYAAGEGVGGLADRFRAAADSWGVTTLPNMAFFPLVPQLFAADATNGIRAFVADWQGTQSGQLDLLLLDTFATATLGGKENATEDMSLVMDNARAAGRALGCAVLMVHHAKKDGSDYRGNSAIHGSMDCMMQVTKNGENALELFKLKDGRPWARQKFSLICKKNQLSPFVLWEGNASAHTSNAPKSEAATIRDDILELLKQHPFDKFTAADIGHGVGCDSKKADRALGDLQRTGKVERSAAPGKKRGWEWSLHSSIAAVKGMVNP